MVDFISNNSVEILLIVTPIVLLSPYVLYKMITKKLAEETLVETLSNEQKSLLDIVKISYDGYSDNSKEVYDFTYVQNKVMTLCDVANINYSYRDYLKTNQAFQDLLAKIEAIPPTDPFNKILLVWLGITILAILLNKITK
jgi:hypothetical protein